MTWAASATIARGKGRELRNVLSGFSAKLHLGYFGSGPGASMRICRSSQASRPPSPAM